MSELPNLDVARLRKDIYEILRIWVTRQWIAWPYSLTGIPAFLMTSFVSLTVYSPK